MGRRFQAYYVYKGKDEDRKISFHMQVCCGDDTVCLLEQVLLFAEKYTRHGYNLLHRPEFDFYDNSVYLLKSLTNVVQRNGVFLNAKQQSDEDYDPLKVDNNDGIFIVDLRGKKPKYCLMNHDFKVVTPGEYFEFYRHEYTEKDLILKEIPEVVKNIEQFETLTLEEVKELYPTLVNSFNR